MEKLYVSTVDQHGDILKEGVNELRKQGLDYTADQVSKYIQDDKYNLLVGAHRGFFVVQIRMRPKRHLFVWLAWSGEKIPLLKIYQPALEEMARQAGAQYIEMWSKRRGFERQGWEIEDIIYRRSL